MSVLLVAKYLRLMSTTRPPISDLTHDLVPFPKLHRRAFQHPLDLAAVATLENTPIFPQVIRWFHGVTLDTQSHMHALGSEIRCGPNQYPSLYRAFVKLVETLDMPQMPELFISNGPMNAYASGHEKVKVTLTASILGLMDDDEILFIIGHELGHIKCEHVLFNQVYRWLANGAFSVFEVPFAGALLHGVTLAMFLWSRKAEFSADRAGLLACQNPDAALRALSKLSSSGYVTRNGEALNREALHAQMVDFKETVEDSLLNRVLEASMSQHDTHPNCISRLEMLRAWAEDGSYEKFLKGQYTKEAPLGIFTTVQSRTAILCPCGGLNEEGSTYCSKCRQRIANPQYVCGGCSGPVTPPTCLRCGRDFISN